MTNLLPFSFDVLPAASQPEWLGFEVIRFRGVQAINRPYEYEVYLQRDEASPAAAATGQICGRRAKLTLDAGGGKRLPVHGIIAECDQLYSLGDQKSGDRRTIYRMLLVPQLHTLSLVRDTRCFAGKPLQDIIRQVLEDGGLTANQFRFRLAKTDRTIEFCCQYEESALAFVTRWMEREGLFYFFEQAADHEHMVIADSSAAHRQLSDTGIQDPAATPAAGRYDVGFNVAAGAVGVGDNTVARFVRSTRVVPASVGLRSPDYNSPTTDNAGSAKSGALGAAGVHDSAEQWFPHGAGAARLAGYRAESLAWQADQCRGAGREMRFQPGGKFTLSSTAVDYMIVSVEHRGQQEAHLAKPPQLVAHMGLDTWTDGYGNTFTCIAATREYRAEAVTPWPRVAGTLSAITVGSDDTWADMDTQGRYRVKLPFLAIASDGFPASTRGPDTTTWVRQVQPYAGKQFGIHFPLPKGVEVKLAFEHGDPDRPVIVGAVHNPSYPDQVHGGNPYTSGVRTIRGNRLEFSDHSARQTAVLAVGEDAMSKSFLELGHGGLFKSAKLDSHFTTINGMLMNNIVGGFGVNINGGFQATMMSGQALALLGVIASRLGSAAAWGEHPNNDTGMAIGKQVVDLAVTIGIMQGMSKFFLSGTIPGLLTNISNPTTSHADLLVQSVALGKLMKDLSPSAAGVLGHTNNRPGLLGSTLGNLVSGSVLRVKQNAPHVMFSAVHGNNYQFGQNVLLNATEQAFLLGHKKVTIGAKEMASMALFEGDRQLHAVGSTQWHELRARVWQLVMGSGHLSLKRKPAAPGSETVFQARSSRVLISTNELLPPEVLKPDLVSLGPGTNPNLPYIVLSTASPLTIGKPTDGATISLTKTPGAVKVAAAQQVEIKHLSGATIEIDPTGTITLKTGPSSVKIAPSGIVIKGPMVTIESTAGPTTVKGKAGVTLDGTPAKLNGKGLMVEMG